LKLARFVEEERKKHVVYPSADEVFAWTRMTDIMDVSGKDDNYIQRILITVLLQCCDALCSVTGRTCGQ